MNSNKLPTLYIKLNQAWNMPISAFSHPC